VDDIVQQPVCGNGITGYLFLVRHFFFQQSGGTLFPQTDKGALVLHKNIRALQNVRISLLDMTK